MVFGFKGFVFSSLLTIGIVQIGVTGASAAAVTLESVSGTWTSATGGDRVRGIGQDQLSWGQAAYKGGNKSGYGFTAVPTSPALDLQAGRKFDVGTFTHYNNPIKFNGAITAASLTVSLRLNINGTAKDIATTFDFTHFETINSASTCANGGANGAGVNAGGCADRVSFVRNASHSETITVDGQDYAFTLGGFDELTEFWTSEAQDNSAMLNGYFTVVGGRDTPTPPAPVPLPAAAWILGTGVAGLVVASRRVR